MLQVIHIRPTQTQTQTVQSILNQGYNRNSMRLVLSKKTDYWGLVLSCRDWRSLKELRLNMCQVNDTNIGILQKNEFENLSQLSLWDNKITHTGIAMMINWEFSSLTYLVLGKNKIGSSGVALLTKANFPVLTQLDLIQCEIGNEGGKKLTKSKWANLTQLSIYKNNIRLEGLMGIACLNSWDNLKRLDGYYQCQPADAIAMNSFVVMKSKNAQIKLKTNNDYLKARIEQIMQNKRLNEQ